MKRKYAIVCSILLIIFELWGLIPPILKHHNLNLIYYTQDSNYFSLIITSIYFFYLISGKEIPEWVSILKYTSVLSLMITFLVVLFILVPMYHFYFEFLYDGCYLFLHTLCPLLSFFSFLFFESHKIGTTDHIKALWFTIFYALLLIPFNVFGIVEGPYPFLLVHKNPIYMSVLWFILIIGGAYVLSSLIRYLKLRIDG